MHQRPDGLDRADAPGKVVAKPLDVGRRVLIRLQHKSGRARKTEFPERRGDHRIGVRREILEQQALADGDLLMIAMRFFTMSRICSSDSLMVAIVSSGRFARAGPSSWRIQRRWPPGRFTCGRTSGLQVSTAQVKGFPENGRFVRPGQRISRLPVGCSGFAVANCASNCSRRSPSGTRSCVFRRSTVTRIATIVVVSRLAAIISSG